MSRMSDHFDTPPYGRGLHSSGFVLMSHPGPYRFWIFSAYTPEYASIVHAHLLPSLRARLAQPNFVRYSVQPMSSKGSWVLNCGKKATAILVYWRQSHESVLWVDADAEVVGDLSPLNDLVGAFDVCVLRPDRAMRQRWPLVNSSCLSGTILFSNARPILVERLLMRWAQRVEEKPTDLDQDVLGEVLAEFERDHGLRVGQLPPEFVCIPDLMPDVPGAIVHRQASRRMRDSIGN